MKAKSIWVCVLLILIGTLSFAQQTTTANQNQQETTIEQLYLQNVELQIVREEANAPSQEAKLRALGTIGELIRNNRVPQADPATFHVLDYLAGEGILRRSVSGSQIVNYFPEVRRQSCELLGLLGGEPARQSLISVLLTDDEPMVLAEAAFALGRIGTDADLVSSRAISQTVINESVAHPNNNFAAAAVNAFRRIADANSGIKEPMVFQALITIVQGNYLVEVKQAAIDLLTYLRQNFHH